MIGLQRGTVKLESHQKSWEDDAKKTITLLWTILGNIAVDIQHIGSTAIQNIHAKPIIDIVVGVNELEDIKPFINLLEQKKIIYRGQDLTGQLLFVIGDFERDIRTHHIHIVKWNSTIWNDYINFRDYLNSVSQKAAEYDALKLELEKSFHNNRFAYTNGKKELINKLLEEARQWRLKQLTQQSL